MMHNTFKLGVNNYPVYQYVVSDEPIKKDDWFLTKGVNPITLEEQDEIQRCNWIDEEKNLIVSYEMDTADPLGSSYFSFPLDKSKKIVSTDNPFLVNRGVQITEDFCI